MVIKIISVIGGFYWVDLVWLVALTVRFQPTVQRHLPIKSLLFSFIRDQLRFAENIIQFMWQHCKWPIVSKFRNIEVKTISYLYIKISASLKRTPLLTWSRGSCANTNYLFLDAFNLILSFLLPIINYFLAIILDIYCIQCLLFCCFSLLIVGVYKEVITARCFNSTTFA